MDVGQAGAAGVELAADGFVASAFPDASLSVNPDSSSSAVHRMCEELGMVHVHLRSLRHFATTELLTGRIDIRKAAELLGHANPSLTRASTPTPPRSASARPSTSSAGSAPPAIVNHPGTPCPSSAKGRHAPSHGRLSRTCVTPVVTAHVILTLLCHPRSPAHGPRRPHAAGHGHVLGRKIKRNIKEIEAAMLNNLSNASVESNNAAIGRIRPAARGFHNPESFITMIMLDRAGIAPKIPWAS